MFNQNTQPDILLTQMPPIDPTLPVEVHEFFRDEQLCGTDPNLHQIVRNSHRICDTESLNLR